MKTKWEFRYFTIADHEKEQEYLQCQHREGWKITHVFFPGFFRFEKCQPENVTYQLDYNPDRIAHKDEYIKMFADMGWECLQDYYGYSYFRKPSAQMNGDEEIFCDNQSRLEMVNRVFKKRGLILLAIFLGILSLLIASIFAKNSSLTSFASGALSAMIAGFLFLGISYLRLRSKLKA